MTASRYKAKGPITTRKACRGTQTGPCPHRALIVARIRFKRCPACGAEYERLRRLRIENPKMKPCEGTQDRPCPDGVKVKAAKNCKRCVKCAELQRRYMKRSCYKKHWKQYDAQRKWRRAPHPRRRALIELALELGLPAKAA